MNIYSPPGSGAPGPPDWVIWAVIGQCVVFSSFAVTQFVLLFFDSGPKWYIYGEISYLILSLVAKGFLGLILIANVFILESIDEASCLLHISLNPFSTLLYQASCVRSTVGRPLQSTLAKLVYKTCYTALKHSPSSIFPVTCPLTQPRGRPPTP